MAEAILRETLRGTDLDGRVVVDSAGTHRYHVGDDADARARQILAEAGYSISHRARRFDPGWLEERDLILAMDAGHLRELRRWPRATAAPTRPSSPSGTSTPRAPATCPTRTTRPWMPTDWCARSWSGRCPR